MHAPIDLERIEWLPMPAGGLPTGDDFAAIVNWIDEFGIIIDFGYTADAYAVIDCERTAYRIDNGEKGARERSIVLIVTQDHDVEGSTVVSMEVRRV